ncbi:MAG: pseudouridine synthase [Nitrosomonas sp.]
MRTSRPLRSPRKPSQPTENRSQPKRVDQTITHKLQKLLAQSGLGSRREMEALIAEGQVSINGKVAKVGDRISTGDLIRVKNRLIRINTGSRLPRIMFYHKPEGEIVSRHDPEGRPSVFDKLPQLKSSRWVSIGRLDFNTSGLLIFTTSGELANQMTHPRFQIEREYAVRIIGQLTPEQMTQLTRGVELEDGIAKFDMIIEQGGEGSNRWYHAVIKEGRNREIRRMFEKLGIAVSRLIRVRFGPIRLPPYLKRGMLSELKENEVRQIMVLFNKMIEPKVVVPRVQSNQSKFTSNRFSST